MLVLIAVLAVSFAGFAHAQRTCCCVATSGGGAVNIRSCPDTTCSVLGAENPGRCYDYQNQVSGAWLRINYNGNTNAWVHSDYMSGPQRCGGGSTGLCSRRMCSSFTANSARTCDAQGCGNYGASRGSGPHGGLDVRCNGGDTAYAPFPGTMVREAFPYGDGTCCDTGYLLRGNGAWAGYEVMVFYTRANVAWGSTVTAGQAIGTHTGLHCGCYSTTMTDHAHYQLYHSGAIIDPASFVLYC